MFSRDGLEALRDQAIKQNNRQFIQFPAGAKEIKAEWRPSKTPTSLATFGARLLA